MYERAELLSIISSLNKLGLETSVITELENLLTLQIQEQVHSADVETIVEILLLFIEQSELKWTQNYQEEIFKALEANIDKANHIQLNHCYRQLSRLPKFASGLTEMIRKELVNNISLLPSAEQGILIFALR